MQNGAQPALAFATSEGVESRVGATLGDQTPFGGVEPPPTQLR
jgi:hypothetical protein